MAMPAPRVDGVRFSLPIGAKRCYHILVVALLL
jgi:hypothetical protein